MGPRCQHGQRRAAMKFGRNGGRCTPPCRKRQHWAPGAGRLPKQKSVPGEPTTTKQRDRACRWRATVGPCSARYLAASLCEDTRAAAISRPEHGRICSPFRDPKTNTGRASATFQWYRCLASRAAADHKVVGISMDETSVKIWPGALRGCVAEKLAGEAPAPLEQRRSQCSAHAPPSACDEWPTRAERGGRRVQPWPARPSLAS